MVRSAFEQILAITAQKGELEATVEYLTECLRPIIKQGESVLICFPRDENTDLGSIAWKAVRGCGGFPVCWEQDLRWRELLRLAFISRATTIIAPPLVVLGLSKLAAFQRVPLYLTNAVLAGYPCLEWMMDGIENGLDCRLWGIFGPGIQSILSGFSCQCGRGVHIREDQFGIEIVDESGKELPDCQYGRVMIYHRDLPEVLCEVPARGSILDRRCPCGNPSIKLVGVDMGLPKESSLFKIAEELLYWNSILDCRLERTPHGLEMEIVCFQGEKMPRFPDCAKLVLRAWNPEKDIPLFLTNGWIVP